MSCKLLQVSTFIPNFLRKKTRKNQIYFGNCLVQASLRKTRKQPTNTLDVAHLGSSLTSKKAISFESPEGDFGMSWGGIRWVRQLGLIN